MRKYNYVAAIVLFLSACKMSPGSNRHYADGNDKKVYKLSLRPAKGVRYYYDVSNESEAKMEIGGKKIDNVNRSRTGVNYAMERDSAGNLVFNMTYDKVHVYTKNDDTEQEMDATNAATSEDAVEKMLGALTSTRIVAVISPTGEVKSVSGYKEMTDKIMTGFVRSDENTRRIARSRLEQFIGNGIIRKNMDQLFKIFPDSAVHIGDRWRLSSQQKGDLNLISKSSFKLESIEDGLALVTSEGEMSSDSSVMNLMGNDVMANLKGMQQGKYEMDVQSGMLISAVITASVNGTIGMMGQEVPITLEMNVKMHGMKMK